MSLTALLATIESHETAARVNAASSLRVALRLAWESPDVRRVAALVERRTVAARVARCVAEIVEREPDPRFENPSDAALLIYQWVLVKARSPFARFACLTAITSEARPDQIPNESFMVADAAKQSGDTEGSLQGCVDASNPRRLQEQWAAKKLGAALRTPTFVVGVEDRPGRVVGWPVVGFTPRRLTAAVREVTARFDPPSLRERVKRLVQR